MIFLTVGSHEPFDRLVEAVDVWCGANPGELVFSQITARARYKPRHFKYVDNLAPEEYRKVFAEARLIISHAGMGSILTALLLSKPIVILPRLSALHETRNDHQIPTVKAFRNRSGVMGALEASEVGPILDRVVYQGREDKVEPISAFAGPALISAIADFIRAA